MKKKPEFYCDACHDIAESGGLLFSPPQSPTKTCVKRQLCNKCYELVVIFMSDLTNIFKNENTKAKKH
jgi:hypothetical protein